MIEMATKFRVNNQFARSTLEVKRKISAISQYIPQAKVKAANQLTRSTSKLKRKISVLHYIPQFITKMIVIVTSALQFMKIHMPKKRKQLIVVLFVSALSIFNVLFLNTISAQLLTRTNLYSYGSIQIQTTGVKAYSDVTCTTPASNVAWGTLTPGISRTNIIYIKNEGSSPLTLSLDTTNWNPTNAPNYITLNWNYDGRAIAPNFVTQIVLTLSVSPNISGISSFNFEIVIGGTA
jgi:hypothetical protein